jgi:hypothetical protein
MSSAQAQAMVRSADLKGDNKLSWGEFCLMMSNRLPVRYVSSSSSYDMHAGEPDDEQPPAR